MKLHTIAIVYRKEMLDTLRDRRTLISMVVVPLLLMPVLIVGMGTLSLKLVRRAMYPAIDLSAGEKERGTIETILASPVGRSELVLGKFFTVLTASLATAVLSLASLAATFYFLPASFDAAGRGPQVFQMTISGKGVAAVLIMILPLAVMFAAALLAIALLARSFKEAQSYISPLMIVVILPAVGSLLPGVELDWRLALIPILNTSLVSKEILTGNYPWKLILLIFASSCVYAVAALIVAVRAFQRESVLFRT